MRPILIMHKGKMLPGECVNEDRHDVFFVRQVMIDNVNVFLTGVAPTAQIIFLYGYSPTKDDYSVVSQMRGIH